MRRARWHHVVIVALGPLIHASLTAARAIRALRERTRVALAVVPAEVLGPSGRPLLAVGIRTTNRGRTPVHVLACGLALRDDGQLLAEPAPEMLAPGAAVTGAIPLHDVGRHLGGGDLGAIRAVVWLDAAGAAHPRALRKDERAFLAAALAGAGEL